MPRRFASTIPDAVRPSCWALSRLLGTALASATSEAFTLLLRMVYYSGLVRRVPDGLLVSPAEVYVAVYVVDVKPRAPLFVAADIGHASTVIPVFMQRRCTSQGIIAL